MTQRRSFPPLGCASLLRLRPFRSPVFRPEVRSKERTTAMQAGLARRDLEGGVSDRTLARRKHYPTSVQQEQDGAGAVVPTPLELRDLKKIDRLAHGLEVFV